MPKKIERSPTNFEQKIPCLRMDLDELFTLLENLGVKKEAIYGISNEAEFQGLEDIKSAPAWFSGEPFLVLSTEIEGGRAFANIDFKNSGTVVSGGERKGGYSVEENSRVFAEQVYEELLPFSNKWEAWGVSVITTLYYLLTVALLFASIVAIYGVWEHRDLSFFEGYEEFWGLISVGYFLSGGLSWVIKRRQPVLYNPRKTFWQRHGEAVVVGLIGVIGSVLVWFLTWSLGS